MNIDDRGGQDGAAREDAREDRWGAAGAEKVDQRRETGLRTRQRLLETTCALLAERGEDAISLRDITTAAGANVAAVSYHFGSKEDLVRVATDHALETVVESLEEHCRQLADDATVSDIARAIAQPYLETLRDPDHRPLLQIIARALGDQRPEQREQYYAKFEPANGVLLGRLHHALPTVPRSELRFRIEGARRIAYLLASGQLHVNLQGKSNRQLERWLVAFIAGALSGDGRQAVGSRAAGI